MTKAGVHVLPLGQILTDCRPPESQGRGVRAPHSGAWRACQERVDPEGAACPPPGLRADRESRKAALSEPLFPRSSLQG